MPSTPTPAASSWTFATGAALHSSPAVADGTVFIGSRDNHVYALDAASGDLRWRFAGGRAGRPA